MGPLGVRHPIEKKSPYDEHVLVVGIVVTKLFEFKSEGIYNLGVRWENCVVDGEMWGLSLLNNGVF